MQKQTIIDWEEKEHLRLNELEKQNQRRKHIDFGDAQLTFDRVRFIYETNIELIDVLKRHFKDVYKQALEICRQEICPDLQELLKVDAAALKRIYPLNQPDVFLRLQAHVKEKEQKELQKELNQSKERIENLNWEQKPINEKKLDQAYSLNNIMMKRWIESNQVSKNTSRPSSVLRTSSTYGKGMPPRLTQSNSIAKKSNQDIEEALNQDYGNIKKKAPRQLHFKVFSPQRILSNSMNFEKGLRSKNQILVSRNGKNSK